MINNPGSTYWHLSLQGKSLPIHENDPQEGWYRTRPRKGYRSLAVRIWRNEGSAELLALRDGKRVDPCEVWTWCCLNPVSIAAYEAVVERGAAWPDEIGIVVDGSRQVSRQRVWGERGAEDRIRRLRVTKTANVSAVGAVPNYHFDSRADRGSETTAILSADRTVNCHFDSHSQTAANVSAVETVSNCHFDSHADRGSEPTAILSAAQTVSCHSDSRTQITDALSAGALSSQQQVAIVRGVGQNSVVPGYGQPGHNSAHARSEVDDRLLAGALPDEGGQTAEALTHAIACLWNEVSDWLTGLGEIADQVTADRCANFADAFASFEKQAEELRTTTKKPVLDEGRAIDARWKPVVSAAEEAKRRCKKALEPFLIAETERLEQQFMTQLQAENGDLSLLNLSSLTAKAGTFGRTISLRRVRKVRVLDRRALMVHYHRDPRFLNDEAVQKALAKLAEQDLQAGLSVPGAESVEEKVAA